jgi:hypothetical protein
MYTMYILTVLLGLGIAQSANPANPANRYINFRYLRTDCVGAHNVISPILTTFLTVPNSQTCHFYLIAWEKYGYNWVKRHKKIGGDSIGFLKGSEHLGTRRNLGWKVVADSNNVWFEADNKDGKEYYIDFVCDGLQRKWPAEEGKAANINLDYICNYHSYVGDEAESWPGMN